ncbi:hypothetical protein COCON_G00226040 [Conger conger]|uniref:Uncharacterized protein n=1 Tax=Conger conger TaxID=82655 RepID=A0A9Q1HN25_CONCO|nr:hypothetical protein COCON_G00226040 [Conger conger]
MRGMTEHYTPQEEERSGPFHTEGSRLPLLLSVTPISYSPQEDSRAYVCCRSHGAEQGLVGNVLWATGGGMKERGPFCFWGARAARERGALRGASRQKGTPREAGLYDVIECDVVCVTRLSGNAARGVPVPGKSHNGAPPVMGCKGFAGQRTLRSRVRAANARNEDGCLSPVPLALLLNRVSHSPGTRAGRATDKPRMIQV